VGSTIVSTELVNQIAANYNVETKVGLTGFKWIAKMVVDFPELDFIGGGEESFGYMVGDFVRDKDAVTATLLACEVAAYAKQNGSSFYHELLNLYVENSFYKEHLISITKKGMDGAAEIKQMLSDMRNNPLTEIDGEKIESLSDYQASTKKNLITGEVSTMDIPKSNVLIYQTASGTRIAARPSGTEPKIKFYFSVNAPLDKVENAEKVKDILKYEKKYRKFTLLNVVFNIFYAIFNVLSVLAFIPVLGILFETDKEIVVEPTYNGITSIGSYLKESFYFFISEKIENDGQIQTLLFICLLALSLFFLKNFFRYLASYVITFLRTGVVKDLRDKLYHKIVELPISYFTEKRKGDIIARMTADVQEVEVSILTSIETIVREPLTVVIAISIMLFMSVKLTLFVFILLPVSGFIISSISKKLKANSVKAQQETGTFLSFIEETLSGLRVIKGFNSEKIIERKFNSSTTNFKNLMTSVFHRQTLASPMSEFLGSATIIAILWFGGREVLSNTSSLQPDEFMGYIVLFYTVLNPIKLITTSYYNIQKGEASAERIMQVLNTENHIKDKPDATVKSAFNSKIEFKNISFIRKTLC
jgi:hypothetical protein